MNNFEIKDRFIVLFTNQIKKDLVKYVGKAVNPQLCHDIYSDIQKRVRNVFAESKSITDKEKVIPWFSDAVYLMLVPDVPGDAGFQKLPLPHKPNSVDFCTSDIIHLMKILDQTNSFLDLEFELNRRTDENQN